MTTQARQVVAAAVISAIDRAGHTPQWLAERSGIAPRALQEMLSLRRDFTIVDLGDIAAALGIPVSELVPGRSVR